MSKLPGSEVPPDKLLGTAIDAALFKHMYTGSSSLEYSSSGLSSLESFRRKTRLREDCRELCSATLVEASGDAFGLGFVCCWCLGLCDMLWNLADGTVLECFESLSPSVLSFSPSLGLCDLIVLKAFFHIPLILDLLCCLIEPSTEFPLCFGDNNSIGSSISLALDVKGRLTDSPPWLDVDVFRLRSSLGNFLGIVGKIRCQESWAAFQP